MVHHNYLPFLLVHLVLDLVGRGDCEAPRAGDHVPLLQKPKGVVETLTLTIVMMIFIIACAAIIKHHDHMVDLFTICGENFSIRGQKNSSEPHQVLFWKLDGTVGNAHLHKIQYNGDQQRLGRGELWETDVTNKNYENVDILQVSFCNGGDTWMHYSKGWPRVDRFLFTLTLRRI